MTSQIFVTTGTQLPFDRLIVAVDNWAKRNDAVKVVAQTSASKVQCQNITTYEFLTPVEYSEYVRQSKLIVGHAGMGTIITALEEGLPAVLMPRKFSLGEHRNDHQLSTVSRFEGVPGIYIAKDEDELVEILDHLEELVAASDTVSEGRSRLIGYLENKLLDANLESIKKKRVLYLTNLYPTDDAPSFGTFVKKSLDGLAGLGWNVELVSLTQFGSGALGYLKFYLGAFLKLLRFKGLVYIHYVSHSAPPALLASYFNRKLDIVLHYHGSDAFPESYEGGLRRKVKSMICRWANRRAKLVVAPSRTFSQRLYEKYSIPADKLISSASGGFDPGVFFPGGERNPGSRKRVIFVSRMIAGKGADVAAKTAVSLVENGVDADFVFVGDGPQKADVLNILQPLIERGVCEVHGALSQAELATQFRLSDFLLFPSTRQGESLGLLLLEAMACRVVPIAYYQGASPEVLKDLAEDLLCNPAEDFSAFTVELLQCDDVLLERYKTRAEEISRDYRTVAVARDLSEELEALL